MEKEIQHKIDFKTKPLGALGQLEKTAKQIALYQNTLEPALKNPHILVFAADHGIANEGVSAYPQEVTFQMVMNFLNGGAAINVFSKKNNITLKIIDAGVNFDFETNKELISTKIAYGTKSFLSSDAMTQSELDECFGFGKDLVQHLKKINCNVVGFGEMGIGNTSSASMIMHYITQLPLEECVGKGTGLQDEQLKKKLEILTKSVEFQGKLNDPKEILQKVGGFEIAQMCGAMLEAYHQNMLILVDGFISTAAFLVAQSIEPKCMDAAIFSHQSDESGHSKMLNYLNATPLLKLDLRLGEGTGCAIVYPVIESAVAFLNEMASFESAGVSNKENS